MFWNKSKELPIENRALSELKLQMLEVLRRLDYAEKDVRSIRMSITRLKYGDFDGDRYMEENKKDPFDDARKIRKDERIGIWS